MCMLLTASLTSYCKPPTKQRAGPDPLPSETWNHAHYPIPLTGARTVYPEYDRKGRVS